MNITWLPLREINKSGGNKFVAPSKAYIKFQNIGKRSGTSFTSTLKFFVVMSEARNLGIGLPQVLASVVVKIKESHQETAL